MATASIAQPLEKQGLDSRRHLLFVGITFASLVYLLGLIYYAQMRPVDGDEGYYVSAARLVWEGKIPYRDFAYPQAPLLPYIYSWIWAVHPRSLLAMRFFSCACGAIAVFLWGVCLVSARKLPLRVALATFAIVLLNPYWVSWNVVVKTFAVANLLTTIAVICLYLALQTGRARWFFTAALALGTCACVRGLYLLLPAAVFLWLFHLEWRAKERSFPKSLAFLGGAACGMSPMVFSFLGDPHAFVFNNVQYHHLLFSHVTLRNTLHMYLILAVNLFYPFRSLAARYFTVETVLAVVGGLSLLKLRKSQAAPYSSKDYLFFQLTFLMLLVYLATIGMSLIPPPDQYFNSPLLPFLVPFMAEGLRVAFRSSAKWVVALAIMLPIFSFYEISAGAKAWAGYPWAPLSSYRRVTQVIEANSKADDVVLSLWPGYVFESGRRYFPGAEDHFNYAVARKIDPEARSRYHVIFNDEIMSAVASRSVQLLVTDPNIWHFKVFLSPAERAAFRTTVDANYELVATIDGVEVYRRR